MNYPFSEHNPICRLLGHRYGRMYFAEPYVRQTCRLDGHTFPPMPRVPQSREDYDDWIARGKPKDADGNWIEREATAS